MKYIVKIGLTEIYVGLFGELVESRCAADTMSKAEAIKCASSSLETDECEVTIIPVG